MKIFEKVYNIVSNIPKGKVATYGLIAKKININNPKVVGFALHRNMNPNKIPCHRVVYSTGKLSSGYAFGGVKKQKEKLKQEGVFFIGKGLVNLKRSLIDF